MRCASWDSEPLSGGVIESILFADYGTPDGYPTSATTGSFTSSKKCTCANATMETITKLCVGKPACKLDAITHQFLCADGKDPCPGTPKHLSVSVQCSKKAVPSFCNQNRSQPKLFGSKAIVFATQQRQLYFGFPSMMSHPRGTLQSVHSALEWASAVAKIKDAEVLFLVPTDAKNIFRLLKRWAGSTDSAWVVAERDSGGHFVGFATCSSIETALQVELLVESSNPKQYRLKNVATGLFIGYGMHPLDDQAILLEAVATLDTQATGKIAKQASRAPEGKPQSARSWWHLEGLPSKLLRNKAFVNPTIQAQRCDSSDANQKGWSLSASGQIMFTPPKSATAGGSSWCVDLSACDTTNCRPISMKPCNDEKTQQFKYVMKHEAFKTPGPGSAGQLVSLSPEFSSTPCLNVDMDKTGNLTRDVMMYSCNSISKNAPNEMFAFGTATQSDGTLRDGTGHCMAITQTPSGSMVDATSPEECCSACSSSVLSSNSTGGCIAWRQTQDCDPNGARDISSDKSCDALIDSGASGYCECANHERRMAKQCVEGKYKTCREACALCIAFSFQVPSKCFLHQEPSSPTKQLQPLAGSVSATLAVDMAR
jgi:hypothetical protein